MYPRSSSTSTIWQAVSILLLLSNGQLVAASPYLPEEQGLQGRAFDIPLLKGINRIPVHPNPVPSSDSPHVPQAPPQSQPESSPRSQPPYAESLNPSPGSPRPESPRVQPPNQVPNGQQAQFQPLEPLATEKGKLKPTQSGGGLLPQATKITGLPLKASTTSTANSHVPTGSSQRPKNIHSVIEAMAKEVSEIHQLLKLQAPRGRPHIPSSTSQLKGYEQHPRESDISKFPVSKTTTNQGSVAGAEKSTNNEMFPSGNQQQLTRQSSTNHPVPDNGQRPGPSNLPPQNQNVQGSTAGVNGSPSPSMAGQGSNKRGVPDLVRRQSGVDRMQRRKAALVRRLILEGF